MSVVSVTSSKLLKKSKQVLHPPSPNSQKANTRKTESVILTLFKMKSITNSKPIAVEPLAFVTFKP